MYFLDLDDREKANLNTRSWSEHMLLPERYFKLESKWKHESIFQAYVVTR